MAAEFFVGGHAVCVDATWSDNAIASCPLEKGRVYVVVAMEWGRGFGPGGKRCEGLCLGLDGITWGGKPWGFFASRFRPLDENRLSVFRGIANGVRISEVA